jgi:hypothetical protein
MMDRKIIRKRKRSDILRITDCYIYTFVQFSFAKIDDDYGHEQIHLHIDRNRNH